MMSCLRENSSIDRDIAYNMQRLRFESQILHLFILKGKFLVTRLLDKNKIYAHKISQTPLAFKENVYQLPERRV